MLSLSTTYLGHRLPQTHRTSAYNHYLCFDLRSLNNVHNANIIFFFYIFQLLFVPIRLIILKKYTSH